MKGVAYRWGSGFLRRYNQPLSDVEAANNITNTQNADSHQQTPSTRHTPLGSARSRVLEQSEKLRVGWETLSRTGGNMASAVFLLVRLVNEPCDRFFMAAVAAYAQKQDFVSIDLPLDVVNMHFEKPH
ncbi:hypothetical protein GGI07_000372 [Coemansia sp. Benny D115]|nr:hypothetical protein GGI07_000372 [Coemansia sp. Benny D115]